MGLDMDGELMTPSRRARLKKWSKDQLIDQLEIANTQIRELGEKLEERDGAAWRISQDKSKLEGEFRQLQRRFDFYERILKKLVGV
jgi:hypothetical protein